MNNSAHEELMAQLGNLSQDIDDVMRENGELRKDRDRLNWWCSHSLDHCVGVGGEVILLDQENIRTSIDDTMEATKSDD